MKLLTTKNISQIELLTAILFIQEQILSFIPNIQLTIFLIILFSKKIGLAKTSFIVFIHTILDNLVLGSFNILFVISMLIGWLIIPITINTIFKKINHKIGLSLLGILFSFIYSAILIIPHLLTYKMSLMAYLSYDIIWQVLLASSSFISTLLLYDPCSKIFNTI